MKCLPRLESIRGLRDYLQRKPRQCGCKLYSNKSHFGAKATINLFNPGRFPYFSFGRNFYLNPSDPSGARKETGTHNEVDVRQLRIEYVRRRGESVDYCRHLIWVGLHGGGAARQFVLQAAKNPPMVYRQHRVSPNCIYRHCRNARLFQR